MKCLVLCVALLICAADALHRPFARPPQRHHDGRIVGGWSVPVEEYPHHVSLFAAGGFYTCGGSIIKDNYVLTAAHCIDYLYKGFVRVGSSYAASGGTMHYIVNIAPHKNFTYGAGLRDDIAILKVYPPFTYNSAVSPIRLYGKEPGQDLKDGELCTITGFGDTVEGGHTISDILMAVSVPIVSNAECTRNYSTIGWDSIGADRFCAAEKEGGKDSCQGDSGGPVVYNGYQIGIVSYGYGCARPNYPGVYTKVPHFLEWIEEHTQDDD